MDLTLPTTPNRDRILSTIRDENASSTQKAYRQSLSTLNKFFELNRWNFYPTREGQADYSLFVEQTLSYLRHLADEGRSISTINKTLAAVKWVTSYENPTFHAALQTKPVKAFMEGLTRQSRGSLPKKAEAFTVGDLTALYKHLDRTHSPRSIRDKALISLGIATALRSSSLAALTLSDVTPAATIDGLNVRVRFSKTDQRGKGTFIPVARAKKRLLDPVRAVNAWLSILSTYGYTSATHPDFPLFPALRGTKGVQPTPMLHPSVTITDLLRGLVVDAEISTTPVRFSSHSLRATFITLSNQAGVAEKDIALISGHRDMNTLRSYDRTTAEKSAQTDYLSV